MISLKNVAVGARKRFVMRIIKVVVIYFAVYPFILLFFLCFLVLVYPILKIGDRGFKMKDFDLMKECLSFLTFDDLKFIFNHYCFVFTCKKCKEKVSYILGDYELRESQRSGEKLFSFYDDEKRICTNCQYEERRKEKKNDES